MTIFLHGGGDSADYRAATFGRFLAACRGSGPLALIVCEADEGAAAASVSDYSTIFLALGLPQPRIAPVLAFADRPLTAAALPEHLAGLYICGGVTPRYQAALCADPGWARQLAARGLPIGGTSAGAAIAASTAIVGGWQAERDGRPRQLVFPGAGEGLTPLTALPGLGLVPFAVDVHAAQMGTLTRLVNAVALGLVEEGWAIDEDTQLEVGDEGAPALFGRGQAYHARRATDGSVAVRPLAAS